MPRNNFARLCAVLIFMLVFAPSVTTLNAHATTNQNTFRIARETFSVPAGQFISYTVEIYQRARITGRYQAEGGTGNDIEMFVLDEDGFINYKNGHRTQTYYNSGRVTVGSINIVLEPGIYHFVFNNQFSSFTNKIVKSEIYGQ